GVAIDARDFAALRFGVSVIRIGGIGEGPEAVAAEEILPAAIGDAGRILGIADKGAIVLEAAVDLVRIGHVRTDVIELRNGQIVGLPPGVAAVVGIPDAAIVAGDEVIGIVGIDPDVVEIAVGAAADTAETLTAVVAHDER